MKPNQINIRILAVSLLAFAGCSGARRNLIPVDSVARDDLKTVVSVDVSGDNQHLYATAYNPSAVTVFRRDTKTGLLDHVQTLTDPTIFSGVTSIRVSNDGRFAATAAFRSTTVVLLKRDPISGRLTILDTARQSLKSVSGLNFVIALEFSPDSRFIYAVADGSAALNVFHISEAQQLELVQTDRGEDRCFEGARGIALSPDGRSIYVASSRANTLVFLERDSASGKVTSKQILRDEEGSVHGLAGAFSVSCSRDGRNVYTSSGRFRGDNAVSAFRRNKDGTLELLQELVNGTGDLNGFEGGNEIVVSADGAAVYALGTLSQSIACFKRDKQTGKLTHFQTLRGGEAGVGPLGTVSGIGFSADGKFVYAAAEQDGAISIFERR